jgi:hypothetical protein
MLQRFLTAAQPVAREDVDYLVDRMDEVSKVLREEDLAESA